MSTLPPDKVNKLNKISLTARNRLFRIEQVETALCVFEWLMDTNSNDNTEDEVKQTIQSMFESYGWSAMRTAAIQAGLFVEDCWCHCDKIKFMEEESFDWEFVPMVCRALDWERLLQNNHYGDAQWHPDVDGFIATLMARQVLKV
jgi:hypothetical protein